MPLDTSTQVSLTYNGNTYKIWDEGAEEDIQRDGNSKATRRVRCAWTDRVGVCQAILGGTSNVSGTNLFVYGQPYPDGPSFVATRIKTKGDGLRSIGPNGMVAYERAELTIYYTPYYYDQNGIGYQEVNFGSVAVATSQDQPTFKWQDGTPIPPSQTPAIKYSIMEFSQEREVAVLNLSLYASLQDKRNSTPIFGMAADHVLFQGGRSRRVITAIGAQNWAVTFQFSYLSIGWNKLYRADAHAFQTFTYQDGSDLYPAADLNQLFQ